MSARTSGFPAVHSIVMRESVLFTLPVCVFKEMVDCCILLYSKATFTMIIDYQLFRWPVQYWLYLLQYNEVPLSLCNSRFVLQVNHQPDLSPEHHSLVVCVLFLEASVGGPEPGCGGGVHGLPQ